MLFAKRKLYSNLFESRRLEKGGGRGVPALPSKTRRPWTCCTVTSLNPVAFCKGGEEGFQQSKEEEEGKEGG